MPTGERAADRSGAEFLAASAGFELLGEGLGADVESALRTALAGGAVFPTTADPLAIFRESLAASIRSIESHPRGRLFQDFLSKGPYEREGEIPAALRGERLSDEETAAAIRFILSHMVNSFKGSVTEMLATAPCLTVLKQLRRSGELPEETRLYVGDAVRAHRLRGKGLAKAADMHFLTGPCQQAESAGVAVVGVVEVKSYLQSEDRLHAQLDRHLRCAGRGLRVCGVDFPVGRARVGLGKKLRVARIAVLPAGWALPRTFRFEPSEEGRSLRVDPAAPPCPADRMERTAENEWRITLRWSEEALAAAAYEMTFWYMARVGEFIYSRGVPEGWPEMTPAEAGHNAAKMMLYYAIIRSRTVREEQRAIALYNSYGFGYALGMSFRDARRRREMLWPEDLDEILAAGRTKSGCRIWG